MYNRTMTILKNCLDKHDWDDYMLEHGAHPLQLWGWGDVKTAHGWDAYRLFCYNDDEDVVGAVQLLVRRLPWPFRSLSYVPRGPVVDEANREELLSSLANYVKSKFHSVTLAIEPDSNEYTVPDGWKQSCNRILPSKTIILDITRPEPELLNDMVKKTRQYIRKSAAEKIQIKMVKNRTELDKCLEIYRDTSKRANFTLHNDQYYYDVFSKLGDHSPVFAAYTGNEVVSFLWLAISADTAYELYGGMNETGQQLRSNYALKWYAIRKCKEWGLSRYDFGGLLEGGISTFKKGWASEETDLAGTFSKPLSMFYGLWSNVFPTAKIVVRKMKSLFKKR